MKRLKNFLLLLYLLTLIFGCQPEDETDSGPLETAAPATTASATAAIPPTATDSPPQPSSTPPPPTSTLQPTDTPQPTATPTATPINWSLIRNGATILYYQADDLWRSDINGEQRQPLTEGDSLKFWGFDKTDDQWWTGGFQPRPFISPDGRYIAFTQTGRNMVIIDMADPIPPRTLSSGSTLMAWSPDSRYLAYGRNTLYLYDTVTNFASDIASTISGGIHNITWSSDGRFIGFACCFAPPEGEYEGVYYGEIRQYDMETGLVETTGETYNSIGGGTPSLCWQEAGYFLPHQEAEQTSHCTPIGSLVFHGSHSPDKQQYAQMSTTSPENPLHYDRLTVTNDDTDEILWQLDLEEPANQVVWSLDGRYLFLNNVYPGFSPIWRLLADGTSTTPELIIEEAFLIDVVPMWQE